MYIGRDRLDNLICLCDSGSIISCISSRIQFPKHLTMPSTRNPVGANGLKLDNLGDVWAQIEINKSMYKTRLTIIKDLLYPVILGSPFLERHGFRLCSDGTKVEIADKILCRVFETNFFSMYHSAYFDY